MMNDPIELLDHAVEALRAGEDVDAVLGRSPAELGRAVRAGAELNAAGPTMPGMPRPAFVLALEEQLRTDLRLQASAMERTSTAPRSREASPRSDAPARASSRLLAKVLGLSTLLLFCLWGVERLMTTAPAGRDTVGGLVVGDGGASRAALPTGSGATGAAGGAGATSDAGAAGLAGGAAGRPPSPPAGRTGRCEECFDWSQLAAARRVALRSAADRSDSGPPQPRRGGPLPSRGESAVRRQGPASSRRPQAPPRPDEPAAAIAKGPAGGGAEAPPSPPSGAPEQGSPQGQQDRRAATPEPTPLAAEPAPSPTPDCWSCGAP